MSSGSIPDDKEAFVRVSWIVPNRYPWPLEQTKPLTIIVFRWYSYSCLVHRKLSTCWIDLPLLGRYIAYLACDRLLDYCWLVYRDHLRNNFPFLAACEVMLCYLRPTWGRLRIGCSRESVKTLQIHILYLYSLQCNSPINSGCILVRKYFLLLRNHTSPKMSCRVWGKRQSANRWWRKSRKYPVLVVVSASESYPSPTELGSIIKRVSTRSPKLSRRLWSDSVPLRAPELYRSLR